MPGSCSRWSTPDGGAIAARQLDQAVRRLEAAGLVEARGIRVRTETSIRRLSKLSQEVLGGDDLPHPVIADDLFDGNRACVAIDEHVEAIELHRAPPVAPMLCGFTEHVSPDSVLQ
jgi:hypothetical protein